MNDDRRFSGEGGTTLVELLVAVVILGIGVTGLLTTLAFLFTSTERHRQLAMANTMATRAAEVVADPLQTAFTSCATAQATYQTAVRAQPGLGSVTVDSVKVWSAGAFTPCPATADLPLQQITLTAPSPDGSGPVTMSIVKRGSA